jgi:ribose 5-phosphate isomerase A
MNLDRRLATLGHAVAADIPSGCLLGLGSGSTAQAFVRALGERVRVGLQVEGVATSGRTERLAREFNIPLRSIDDVGRLDLGVDGADEIDPRLNLVKGRGGALLHEKLVACLCEQFTVIAASEKLVDQLGTRTPLPVEVVPFGWKQTAVRLRTLGLKPVLRCGRESVSEPFRTDSGNFVLDCDADVGLLADPAGIAARIKAVTGVVDHGIFAGFATRAVIVDPDGQIRTMTRPA